MYFLFTPTFFFGRKIGRKSRPWCNLKVYCTCQSVAISGVTGSYPHSETADSTPDVT